MHRHALPAGGPGERAPRVLRWLLDEVAWKSAQRGILIWAVSPSDLLRGSGLSVLGTWILRSPCCAPCGWSNGLPVVLPVSWFYQ